MTAQNNIKYICVTGNIACGKSLVGLYLKELYPNAYIIEADAIVHDLLKNHNQTIKKIIDMFGEDILSKNKEIDRKKLGRIVFSNHTAKKRLEKILHPLVIKTIYKWREVLMKGSKNAEKIRLAIAIIPLAFEVKYAGDWDSIVCVAAPRKLQIERLVKKRNFSKKDAISRVNSQLPIEEKMRLSDYVIINTGDKNILKQQVNKLITTLIENQYGEKW